MFTCKPKIEFMPVTWKKITIHKKTKMGGFFGENLSILLFFIKHLPSKRGFAQRKNPTIIPIWNLLWNNEQKWFYLVIDLTYLNKLKLTFSLLTICLCISYSRKGRASDTSLNNSGLKRLILNLKMYIPESQRYPLTLLPE